MRRKTAPKDPVHPKVSRAAASEVGLIAKAEEWAQSAVRECVLDNRSHRTTQGSGVRGPRARLSPAESMDGPASPCSRFSVTTARNSLLNCMSPHAAPRYLPA
jgi:hypothetical protein